MLSFRENNCHENMIYFAELKVREVGNPPRVSISFGFDFLANHLAMDHTLHSPFGTRPTFHLKLSTFFFFFKAKMILLNSHLLVHLLG